MGFLLGFNAHYINITDEQYLDVCLTTLKILNEKIKKLHYVNQIKSNPYG